MLSSQEFGKEFTQVAVILSVIAVLFVTVIILVVLLTHIRDMRRMYRDMLIIEETKKKLSDTLFKARKE
jgi:ABC-type siderophore export system fused ATPase/permease subunit